MNKLAHMAGRRPEPGRENGAEHDMRPGAVEAEAADGGALPPPLLPPVRLLTLEELAAPGAIRNAQVDPEALRVLRRLRHAGYEAYLCGGSVRDLLMAKKPKDFDVATDAHPYEIRKVFRNCRIIGRRFRLAHVFFPGNKIIEVSTFRSRAEFQDTGGELLIREDNTFGTAEEDARRRDFSINGLFYDAADERIIDYVGGLADLREGVVRTIGDPAVRFREDPVRMLRAVKFAARLDLRIDEAAMRALVDLRHEIKKASPPRVLEELYRFLRGGAAERSFDLLYTTGLLDLLVPELAAFLRAADEGADAIMFWRRLWALDCAQAAGKVAGNAVAMAVLFSPLVFAKLAAARAESVKGADLGRVIEDVLSPFQANSALTRGDKNRIREIMIALPRLANAGMSRTAQKRLRTREYFGDALAFYELDCAARGEKPLDWGFEEGAAGEEPGSGGGAGGRPRRKRRRRRRGVRDALDNGT